MRHALVALLLVCGASFADSLTIRGILSGATHTVTVDSVSWTLRAQPADIHDTTPGWRATLASVDTFIFPPLMAWPQSAKLFYALDNAPPTAFSIPGVRRDTWYAIAGQSSQVRFEEVVMGINSPASAQPARAFGAFPSHFTAATRLEFELARDCPVGLTVFDGTGRLVRTLVDGVLPAGSHSQVWDGTDGSGRSVSAGVYLARLAAAGRSSVLRLVKTE